VDQLPQQLLAQRQQQFQQQQTRQQQRRELSRVVQAAQQRAEDQRSLSSASEAGDDSEPSDGGSEIEADVPSPAQGLLQQQRALRVQQQQTAVNVPPLRQATTNLLNELEDDSDDDGQ
jgi:hypothetical protein